MAGEKLNIVAEKFSSIHEMLNTIELRPNNKIMKNEKSSEVIATYKTKFCGTSSYKEAVKLFQTGYTEILDDIKSEMKQKITKQQLRNKMDVNIVGYTPCVPNAIRGIPFSMYCTKQVKQKYKTLRIFHNISASFNVSTQQMIKSGVTTLKLLNNLELNGIQVELNIIFMSGKNGNDRTIGIVTIKNFKERLDLLKCCFPFAHPSMLRRFGFKWLETCNGLKERGFSSGYGTPMSSSEVESLLIENRLMKTTDFYTDLNINTQVMFDSKKLQERIL